MLTKFDDVIDETETYTYDSKNRLVTSQVSGESSVTIGYSQAGRIESKTGVGSYTYGAGGAGPMAVTSANGRSYTKVTNAGGTVVQALAFDAWGLRRDPTDWSALAARLPAATKPKEATRGTSISITSGSST